MTVHPPRAGRVGALNLPSPYLLFLGDATEPGYAKTAFGLRDWAPDLCLGEWACSGATVSLGLPVLAPRDAAARGARAMLIGVANAGGVLRESWVPHLLAAIEAGLDLISGMHGRLGDNPRLAAAAHAKGRRLIDIRSPPSGLPVGNGHKRTGRRLLTVGTDCALGKKYTALALAKAFHGRGLDVDFRATGQTGIMIAGGGMPMDAVVADFEAGAAEILSPEAEEHHWDVIEGQGAILHPAYAAVSLGLLHGSQPDVIVVCHQLERETLLGHPEFPMPRVADIIDLNLRLGRLTNPAIRCAGMSLNTAALSDADAKAVLDREGAQLGLPVADPMRGGPLFERLVDACLAS